MRNEQNLYVKVEWSYTGTENKNLHYSRVLYAYLHPETNEILYLGKADYCSVFERLRGPHKQAIFREIVTDYRLTELHAIVGQLHLPDQRRFSSELLADIESLLIFEIQPPYNIQSRRSRIARPGLFVRCSGDWPWSINTFQDIQ